MAEQPVILRDDTPVRYLKGVGPKTAEKFEKLGICTLADLLCHYPRKYRDFTKPYAISEAPYDMECVIKATVMAKQGLRRISGGRSLVRVTAGDDTAVLEISWFNNPYAADKLEPGETYYFEGMAGGSMLRRQMINPTVRTQQLVELAPLLAEAETRWKCLRLLRMEKQARAKKQRGKTRGAERIPDMKPVLLTWMTGRT